MLNIHLYTMLLKKEYCYTSLPLRAYMACYEPSFTSLPALLHSQVFLLCVVIYFSFGPVHVTQDSFSVSISFLLTPVPFWGIF